MSVFTETILSIWAISFEIVITRYGNVIKNTDEVCIRSPFLEHSCIYAAVSNNIIPCHDHKIIGRIITAWNK
jgi:hypothetical protein